MTVKNTKKPNKKNLTTIICISLAVVAVVAAIILVVLAATGAGSPEAIEINSMDTLTVTYHPDPNKSDYCRIYADFDSGTVTVSRNTDNSDYIPVSSSDVSSSDSISPMQEESQTFSNLDLSELEQFFIENDEEMLVKDLAYDLTDMDTVKILCNMTIQTGDGKYYHMEWLTTMPDKWDDFIALVKKTTGTVLEL